MKRNEKHYHFGNIYHYGRFNIMIKLYKKPNITEADLCNFARISTGKQKRTDEELIRHLIDLEHESIFEHASMTFFVKVPIYTARQWMRHRMGSFTEKSGRYSEMDDFEFGGFSVSKKKECDVETYSEDTEKVINDDFGWYKYLLEGGFKKEEARQMLPLCTLTEFYWTVNLRSLMNFLSLRMDVHAQKDIRENAEKIYKIFEEYYPTVAKAWKQKDSEVKEFLKARRTNAE
jgi:thymidylate synthase (FAD)